MFNRGQAKGMRYLLLGAATLLCAASPTPAVVSGWTPATLDRLEYWIAKAPEDALPLLDTGSLKSAQTSGDNGAVDSAASELALRLARMHLLGSATPAQRAGWHVYDSDGATDLSERLGRAVALDMMDSFFAGLRPAHPNYAVLRAAYAKESDPERRQTIARNMERWRWMPQSLGQDYVIVNAAAFEAELWRGGHRVGTWPVIVGKRSTPTPVFSATITGVTLNPWWVVPASIVKEKHGYFPARQGYVVSNGQISQKPGSNNALGAMKLEMPNPFTVYIHDTPNKELFARNVRAFSHGCIRIGNALDFATTLLDGTTTRKEVDAIVSTRRTTILKLPTRLPVYITYFTAASDGEGKLVVYLDIYDRDDRLGGTAVPAEGCAA